MSRRHDSRRRTAAPIPEHMLVPGYFTELIRRHNWPPMFESRLAAPASRDAHLRGAAAIAHRERQAQDGIGWGTGTSVMPNTPGNPRPAWMVRRPAGT